MRRDRLNHRWSGRRNVVLKGPVQIRLLGELAVVRGGKALALPASKKTRALLGYLAVTGRPHLREHLCDLMWQGPDDPRAALRWSLTKLRAVVGDALEADRERIALAKTATDLRFVNDVAGGGLAAADTDVLREAAVAFRGELLDGLALPDCWAWHEWWSAERASVRALREAVLDALIERSSGSPVEALRWARERVAIDPLSEAAHAAVVRLLADLGRPREAIDQYDACCRMLADALGAKPSPVLLDARMRIGAGRNVQSARVEEREPAPASAPVERRVSDPSALRGTDAAVAPLAGRDEEVRRIVDVVRGAAAGERQPMVVVIGEPGMGKSRLLEELEDRARGAGGRVVKGRAFEAEMVRPYGAWIDALRSVAAADVPEGDRAQLAALLPELGPGTAGDRASLFDAVVRLLQSLAAKSAPLAVILDDLQWLDEASVALLHYAARTVDAGVVVFACGARPGELSDNPAALKLVRGLSREERAVALDLRPLDGAATAVLARSIDRGVDVQRVVRDSGGNPLFALEVARALARGGDGASESLAGLLEERLGRLDERVRELAGWAAAVGRTFGLDLLERVTGLAAGDLLERVGQLEKRGIVRATGDGGSYDFVHDLIRAASYRALSEPRRRLMHVKIARALDADAPAKSALAGDVAHHASLGGDYALAARAAVVAAERSLRVFAPGEATRLADVGLQHVGALTDVARVLAHLALLRVLVLAGSWARRKQALEAELSRVVLEAQDRGLHADAAHGFHTLSVLHFDGGDLLAAHDTTLKAADAGRGGADPLSLARALGDSARCLAMLEREVGRAQAMLSEAVVLADAAGTRLLAVDWADGIVRAFVGDEAEAKLRLERALGEARATEERWAEYECLRFLVQIALESGRAPEAEARCRELLEVASKMGEGGEMPAARALDALARLAGDAEGAGEGVERALASLRAADAKGMLAYALTFAADLDVAGGRLDAAASRAKEALAAAEVVQRRTQVTLARAILARVALARGDRDGAAAAIAPVRAEIDRPLAVSARARASARPVLEALGEA